MARPLVFVRNVLYLTLKEMILHRFTTSSLTAWKTWESPLNCWTNCISCDAVILPAKVIFCKILSVYIQLVPFYMLNLAQHLQCGKCGSKVFESCCWIQKTCSRNCSLSDGSEPCRGFDAVWRIQDVLMRIRIPLFKLIRFRIQSSIRIQNFFS